MAYLVEMTVLDQSGVARVLRYASASAFMTKPSEVPPNTAYEPRLMNGGSYERHCWQRGATRGTSQIGYGLISLNNSDGALDWLLTAGVDGQPITIRKGPHSGNCGTCPVPKPTRRQEGAVERSASAPPLRTTEAPPLPPRQALDLPERADEPQAGTQTDTQTLARTHAKGDSWPAQAPQQEPERLGEAGARRTGRRLAVRRYRGRNT